MGGARWFLATTEQAREMGLKRSWDVDWIAEQGVDRSKPFVLDIDTFHGGYGYSHASIPGVYDEADGFDMATPGKARTWPVLSTCESFGTVVDYRGWVIEHGGYMYVARGRYIAKYRVSDTPGSAPEILSMHQVGSGMAVAGQPAEHGGYLYVPIVQVSDEVLQRFHRLTTVNAEVAEVQTIAMSGTPTGGTYTISYNDGVNTSTTTALAFDAASTVVQAALRLLPGLQKITIVQSGTIPDFTHTITMTAAPGALAATSPPQFTSTDGTSGGTHTITHGTSTPGTTDQWDLGPAATLSRTFAAWFDKLTRATANTVSSATADPMTAGNWGALYPVGDAGRNVTALAVLGDDLFAAKPDGLWSFDETAHARHELTDLIHVIDAQNGIGMAAAQGALFIPHRSGFVRWRPGAYVDVGAEQEGYLEGDKSLHWGRVMGVAPFGKVIYYTSSGAYHEHGLLSSLRPGGRTGGFIPHMSHHFDSPVEHCATLSLDAQPAVPISSAVGSDDSAVGTVTWTNPTYINTSDDAYATAAVGTSHYLKALLPAATRVPTGATVVGVSVGIERKGGLGSYDTGADSVGTGANFASIGTNAWTNPTNITASDDTYATNATAGETQGLRGSNLGYAVPSTATILGITVEVERKASTVTGAISFVAAGGYGNDWSVPASLTVTKPTGTAQYDVLVAAIYWNSESSSLSLPSGWSLISTSTMNSIRVSLVYKVAGASEPSTYTFTASGGSPNQVNTVGIAAYRGCDRTSPIVDSAIQIDGGDFVQDIPGTTGTGTQVSFVVGNVGSGSVWSTPAGFTERADAAGAAVFERSSSGAATSSTRTPEGAWGGCSVLLRVASPVLDSQVRIVKADGTAGTTNKAATSTAWPTTEAYASYGGAADLWDETWTPANVNDADFGAVLSAIITTGTASVDHMRITVTYQDGDIVDSVVKLVRAGSVVGDNKASASQWPATDGIATYGGSSEMWGTTLTPAQCNAADFGVVLSVVTTAGTASVDAITIAIYYEVAGAADPSTYIAVLQVDAAKTTATPKLFKLGRAGLDPANDPNIDHAASDVEFQTPRYFAPDRSVSKVYRALTCWLDLDPETNTPGVQVWATVDDGTEFQMLDGNGAAAEFTTSGAKRLFFPKTAAAVGHWVQFRVTVPALAGEEVALDATIRNVKVYGVYNPVMTQQVTMGLILRQGAHADGQRELRTPDDQAADLADLAKPQAAATMYKDPETGEEGYFDVQGPHITEMRFKSGQQTLRVATVRALVQNYE